MLEEEGLAKGVVLLDAMFDKMRIKMSANAAKERARLHPFSSLVNFCYGANSQDQSEPSLNRSFGA